MKESAKKLKKLVAAYNPTTAFGNKRVLKMIEDLEETKKWEDDIKTCKDCNRYGNLKQYPKIQCRHDDLL